MRERADGWASVEWSPRSKSIAGKDTGREEVEARDPLSRPTSPRRDPRAARTVVSFDWEPFERDVVQVRGDIRMDVVEMTEELEIEDPAPGDDPPDRPVETLVEVLKKARMND